MKIDIRLYWELIRERPGFVGAVLRLHLLTGSQRIAQLVRLRTEHIKVDSILLLDGKGRPGRKARKHVIPLIKPAAKALVECHSDGEFAFSTDGGKT